MGQISGTHNLIRCEADLLSGQILCWNISVAKKRRLVHLYLSLARIHPPFIFIICLWLLVRFIVGYNRASRYFNDFRPPTWEPWYIPLFYQKHGTVIDIGAEVGIHTLTLSKYAARVIAVEPNKVVLPQLYRNLCNKTNVLVAPYALSDRIGKMKIQFYNTHPKKVEVTSITLDAMVRQLKINDLTLIKMDTEGAEHLILRGGKSTLTKQRPTLLIECHDNLRQVVDLMKRYRYRYWFIAKTVNHPHYHEVRWLIAKPIRSNLRGEMCRLWAYISRGIWKEIVSY